MVVSGGVIRPGGERSIGRSSKMDKHLSPEALRDQKAQFHPFTSITDLMAEGPTAVDPWIGPINEAWRDLVAKACRQLRLLELDAPGIILHNEARMVQESFERVLAWSQRPAMTPPSTTTTPSTTTETTTATKKSINA